MPNTRRKATGWFTSMLSIVLPKRLKRLIFLSSMIAYIQGTEKPDKALAGKINQLLSLAHRDNAMNTPSAIKDHIWPNIIPRDEPIGRTGIALCDLCEIEDYQVNATQARFISNRIISGMPEALKYGSNRQIKSDLVTILVNIPKLHHA